MSRDSSWGRAVARKGGLGPHGSGVSLLVYELDKLAIGCHTQIDEGPHVSVHEALGPGMARPNGAGKTSVEQAREHGAKRDKVFVVAHGWPSLVCDSTIVRL
jgi:hypothetical protein